MPAPGAAPEGGKFRAAKPGCRGAFLFGYFLLGKQEKVTRRKGEKGRGNPLFVFSMNVGCLKRRAKKLRLSVR